MTRTDPIIAVRDVAASAAWYHRLLGFRNAHGGAHFAVLLTDDDEVALCLHAWGEHGHPPLMHPGKGNGNGVLLYFRTNEMEAVHRRALDAGLRLEEALHFNANALRNEFSLRDPDGYYLTISDWHRYAG